jgi:large subunit ribosomal protein L25
MSALQAVKRFRIRELGVTAVAPAPEKPVPKAKLPPHLASSSRNKLPVASIENPFLPKLNPKTGRWAPPKYSLRQQAVLIKKARESGTLGLLPPGPKFSVAEIAAAAFVQVTAQGPPAPEKSKVNSAAAPWMREIEWTGEVKEKKVLGAEVGNRLYAGKKRMFKGHKWQRIAEKTEKRRALLMRSMPKRIKEFKQVRLFRSFHGAV